MLLHLFFLLSSIHLFFSTQPTPFLEIPIEQICLASLAKSPALTLPTEEWATINNGHSTTTSASTTTHSITTDLSNQSAPENTSALEIPLKKKSIQSLKKIKNIPPVQETKSSSKKQLSTFVQGFLNYAKTDSTTASTSYLNNDHISMEGSRTGQASEGQLILRRYTEKIIAALQNRFRARRHTLPAQLIRTSNPIKVLLMLNNVGTIHNVALINSSGYVDLDHFALSIFYDTQGSYPSIPTELGLTYYEIILEDVLNLFVSPISSGVLRQKRSN